LQAHVFFLFQKKMRPCHPSGTTRASFFKKENAFDLKKWVDVKLLKISALQFCQV